MSNVYTCEFGDYSPPWRATKDTSARGNPSWRIDSERVSLICSMEFMTERVRDDSQSLAELLALAPEMAAALLQLFSNSHLNLGDMVYDVREREGLGWEGPSVKYWSDAVTLGQNVVKKLRRSGS